jgi:two-component system CitB family response regulator
VIRVLVVEDDFRVAEVHVGFTRRVDGFAVVGTARTPRPSGPRTLAGP